MRKRGFIFLILLFILLALLVFFYFSNQIFQSPAFESDESGVSKEGDEDAIQTLQQVIEQNKFAPATPSFDSSAFAISDEEKRASFTGALSAFSADNTGKGLQVLIWLKQPENQLSITEQQASTRAVQDELEARLPEGVTIAKRFSVLPGVTATITRESAIDALAENEAVDFIAIDKPVFTSLQESGPLIGARQVEQQFQLTGEGVGVCVIDTGVDYTHPNLAGQYVGGYDFFNNDADPMDDNGHGTHVAGIIASNHPTYRGMAPKSKIIAAKAMNAEGAGTFITVALALDYCIQNAALFNIKVMSMSINTYAFYEEATCPKDLIPALKTAATNNLFMAAAAGNWDSKLRGITYPGCAPRVTSVGAVYDANVGSASYPFPSECTDYDTRADKTVCFSDGDYNLDLLAPGASIKSTASSKGTCCGAPSGTFGEASGTSMATPHVTATAALLLQKHPRLIATQTENMLKHFGAPIPIPDGDYQPPRVDALNTIQNSNTPFITISGKPFIDDTINIDYSDPTHPNLMHIMAISTGTTPGIQLPDNRYIPLNPDSLFFTSISNPTVLGITSSQGTLSPSGSARIFWKILSNLPTGVPIYVSVITIDPALPFPGSILSISEPGSVTPLPKNPFTIISPVLPEWTKEPSCITASDINKFFCFGGEGPYGPMDTISVFDSATNTITKRTAKLPKGLTGLSCAFSSTQRKIYCSGGKDSAGNLQRGIIEYNYINEVVTVKNAVFPNGLITDCTEETNGNILCFGGITSTATPNQYSNNIYSYNTATDILSVKNAVLPTARGEMACSYFQPTGKGYCFGGEENKNGAIHELDSILEYDPATDILVTKSATLPEKTAVSTCSKFISKNQIICFGLPTTRGEKNHSPMNRFISYSPATDTVSRPEASMPFGAGGQSCTEDSFSGKIYCFGGYVGRAIFGIVTSYTPS